MQWKRSSKTPNKSTAWLCPQRDSLWSKIQSRTWLCPTQVHYWLKQPGKKSIAATVKSESSMGQPWTENSRAVINFSPHCSHHLHWSLWGKSTASVRSQGGRPRGGFELSPSTYTLLRQSSHTTWVSPIHTRTGGLTATSEGGERERVWGSVRGGEIRTPHTQTPWSVQTAHTLAVTVVAAPFWLRKR